VVGGLSVDEEGVLHVHVQDAVVLADCFPERFSPVTLTRPKALLPLVNVPVLDYTLEWLASQCADVSGSGGPWGACGGLQAGALWLDAPAWCGVVCGGGGVCVVVCGVWCAWGP
jgi:hypothetical protein